MRKFWIYDKFAFNSFEDAENWDDSENKEIIPVIEYIPKSGDALKALSDFEVEKLKMLLKKELE